MTLHQLLDNYTAAFDALDAEKIASLYTLPCAISDGDGNKVFDTYGQLKEKFERNCLAIKEIGYRRAKYQIINDELLGQQARAITVAWVVFTEHQKIEFCCHYVCHNIESEWKFFVANVYQVSYSK